MKKLYYILKDTKREEITHKPSQNRYFINRKIHTKLVPLLAISKNNIISIKLKYLYSRL